MFGIRMDTLPIEQYENELDKFHDKALPYAIRDTLNNAAVETMKLSRKNANRIFEMRNKFSERSIQFEKTYALSVPEMESAAGSLQDYMRMQEEGFYKKKEGKHGIAVPTTYAAGQEIAPKRTKPIRSRNLLARLRIARGLSSGLYGQKYKNPKQVLVRQVQDAIEYGHRVVFLNIRGIKEPGFYRIVGGRRTKRGWPSGAQLRMLYSVKEQFMNMPPRPWLRPSANVIHNRMDRMYFAAIKRQIEINMSRKWRG